MAHGWVQTTNRLSLSGKVYAKELIFDRWVIWFAPHSLIGVTHHHIQKQWQHISEYADCVFELRPIDRACKRCATVKYLIAQSEPPRVSRRPNFLREYPNEKYLFT